MNKFIFTVSGSNEHGDSFVQHFTIDQSDLSGFVDDIKSKSFYRNFSDVTIELVDRVV